MLPHENILSDFEPISLKEMDSVKLQDRVDTKFMFRDILLPRIFQDMQKHYRILEVSGFRYSNYETLYYDTENFALYLQHHNGKQNRFKFRSRKYVESNLHFFEVKFKSNKGRTVKNRIKHHEIVKELEGKASEFLVETSGHDPSQYKARIWVNYRRHTFVSKTTQERLTIDTNLTYLDDKSRKTYDGLVIAEVKQGSALDKSPFIALMKKYHVRENSISKYCLGVISLHPEIKKNRFKPTLLYLNKLLAK
ncbi:MAG: polyphosphate polymerase domain-containing protein [Bacteroidetes bacterium]|nr:polyphosphate polymerase domain-containing protein [Bacteroidota bacterium]